MTLSYRGVPYTPAHPSTATAIAISTELHFLGQPYTPADQHEPTHPPQQLQFLGFTYTL